MLIIVAIVCVVFGLGFEGYTLSVSSLDFIINSVEMKGDCWMKDIIIMVGKAILGVAYNDSLI